MAFVCRADRQAVNSDRKTGLAYDGQTAQVPRYVYIEGGNKVQLPKCFLFVCLFVCLFVFMKHQTMDKFQKLSGTKVFHASLIVP